MQKTSERIVEVEVGPLHRFEARLWLKLVLQSGTGMRIPGEFVIIHLAGREPIDAYLDDRGELEVAVPQRKVKVEFPALFDLTLVESVRGRNVPPQERNVEVTQGPAFERSSAASFSPSVAAAAVYNVDDALGEADEEDSDEDELLQPHDSEPDIMPEDDKADDEDDEDDDGDENEVAENGEGPTGQAQVLAPCFTLETHHAHVFELRGALDIRLSRAFFRQEKAVPYELRDEDGAVLASGSARSRELSFAPLGIGTYALKVQDRVVELESIPARGWMQPVWTGDEDGST